MITTNHQWDFTSLSMVLPSHITQFIYAQPLPILDTPFNLPDDRVWNQHTRYCSVKFACHYLMSKSSKATGRTLMTWSWIWKLKIPPKIKNFIWKCAHHRIPTKSVLFPHADVRDQVCPRCNEIEMPIHVLRDCHFAHQIWSSFPGHLLIADFFKLELHDWCKINSKLTIPLSYTRWYILFTFTLWAIWLGQNSLIFMGKSIPYLSLKQNAISHATKFFFLSTAPSEYSSLSSYIYIRWSPAPFPFITLNTDGSSLSNPGESCAGGVARSANGEWLLSFALHLGVTNNTMAK